MKAYSGSSSDGFSPTLMSATSATATAVAPEPQDPTATFSDVLEQQAGNSATAWPGLTAATLAEPTAAPVLAPVALVVHADPAPTPAAQPMITTFFAPMANSAATTAAWTTPSGTGTPSPVSAATTSDPATNPALPAPVSDDAQTELRRYVWFGLPKTPVATTTTTVTTTTTDIPSSEETAATPAPIFTIPGRAKPAISTPATSTPAAAPANTATTEPTRLTLAQYLLFAQQPKPAAPSPLTTTNSTTDTEPETDASQNMATSEFTLPIKFTLPGFGGTPPASRPSSPLALTTKAATTTTVADGAPDLTSAAIVASVMNRAPATPTLTLPPASQAMAATTAAPAPGFASKIPVSQPQPIAPDAAPAPAVSATARSVFSATPFATNMAHATILAAAHPESASTATATRIDTTTAVALDTEAESAPTLAAPQLNWVPRPATAPSGVEKKSAGSTTERSSVPPKTDSSSTSDPISTLLQAALAASANVTVNQPVTTTNTTPIKTSGGLATAPLASAGTTNDKNQSDMASTLDMQNLVVSNGTHPLVTRTDADVHIQLGTNADFHHALDQVMHVADMSNLSRVTPPLRVAIEIQTPPGAIVNVYISRQSDSSYRAQLSTNDAQALGWVQQQIGSLKDTSDAGTAIRWSPAQLEPGTTATAGAGSSGSDRDLDWNRGGQQGQSGYQDDERESRRRAGYAQADEAESLGFFDAITAVGGAS